MEIVVARDEAGEVVATATASDEGMANLSATVATSTMVARMARRSEGGEAGDAGEEGDARVSLSVLDIAREERAPTRAAARRAERRPPREEQSRQLIVKQMLLVQDARIGLGARASQVTASLLKMVPVVIAVTADGVRVFDVTRSAAPRPLQVIAVGGLRGATVWSDQLLVWGDHGLAAIPAGASTAERPAARLSGPIVDVTSIDGQLAVLTGEGVTLLGPDSPARGPSPRPARRCCLAAGPRLVVGGPGGFDVFDLTNRLAPRRESGHATSACALHRAPATGDTRSVVFQRADGGGGTLLGLTPDGIVEITRFARDPWFHRGARLGTTIARLDDDATGITLLRIAGTYQD